MLSLNLDWFEESEPVENDEGYELDGAWVHKWDYKIVNGEMWVPTAGGMGTEWARIIDGHLNGNPHIVNTYGWNNNLSYPELSPPLDWDYDAEPKWSGAVPYVYHGFDFTEHDVDYTEEFDTFEEAIEAGKELAKLHAKST